MLYSMAGGVSFASAGGPAVAGMRCCIPWRGGVHLHVLVGLLWPELDAVFHGGGGSSFASAGGPAVAGIRCCIPWRGGSFASAGGPADVSTRHPTIIRNKKEKSKASAENTSAPVDCVDSSGQRCGTPVRNRKRNGRTNTSYMRRQPTTRMQE